jgi:hypothetical protein
MKSLKLRLNALLFATAAAVVITGLSAAEVAVTPTETGWDAVIRIPLDRLGGTGPSEENYWRFNAARHLPEVDPISADTVLVTNGTNDIDSLQNSARLIPGARTEIFEEDNVEDGQF